MQPAGAADHAVLQSGAEVLKFVATAVSLITTALVLSRTAFGTPALGDHRSAAAFINLCLMVVASIMAFTFQITIGALSFETSALYAIVFLTWIISHFLGPNAPARMTVFSITMTMPAIVLYISSTLTYFVFEQYQKLADSYIHTSNGTLSAIQGMQEKIERLSGIDTKTKSPPP